MLDTGLGNSVEVLDMYIRLDKNIEEILDYLDKKLVKKNILST